MTVRRAHAWGAAIIAAGALLGLTAALWAGRPGSLWRPLLFGLVAYAASGALVLRWGLAVYGPGGALGALSLAAFTPGVLAALAAPPLTAPAGGTTLIGAVAQLAAAHALMRCLLDPTAQWALAAGAAMVVVPIGAFLHGSESAPMIGLAVFSVFLIIWRAVTAEPWERRARIVQASVVSVGLAWAVALAATLLVTALAHLPSAGEYTRAEPSEPAAVAWHSDSYPLSVVRCPLFISEPTTDNGQRATGNGTRATGNGQPAASSWPLAALLLAAVRPWRRHRRYSDAGWVAAILCLGVPLSWAWGEPGGVFMAPFAALLAGGCWDAGRPAGWRGAAALVVALQIGAAVCLWPHYPGGVRADAWLPMPGIGRGSVSFSGSVVTALSTQRTQRTQRSRRAQRRRRGPAVLAHHSRSGVRRSVGQHGRPTPPLRPSAASASSGVPGEAWPF